ncbi:PREDICTED: uncharacterized protein LOC106808841 [Priapulus caudatus]|nr:PREDICTED: uncharacterized protein LOC106808841 [Priapulus caudatus]
MHLDDPRSPASVQSSSYEPPSPAISYAGSTSQQPSANFVDVGSGNPLIDNMDLMADFMTDSGAPFSPQVDYVDDLVDMSVFNLVCGQGQDMFLGGAGDPDSTN